MNSLFVYGTLLKTDNPFGAYLLNQSKQLRAGKFKGRLYDIGEYPGAIYDPKANSYVYGSIISVNNAKEVFKILDEYEGFGKNELQPNEFIRELIEIENDYESVFCWVYLYNLPVDKLTIISSGRYSL